jgi:hypothetical protein
MTNPRNAETPSKPYTAATIARSPIEGVGEGSL